MFEFGNLISKPYQRDHNPFQKRLDRKPKHSSNDVVGVINRRNGCAQEG